MFPDLLPLFGILDVLYNIITKHDHVNHKLGIILNFKFLMDNMLKLHRKRISEINFVSLFTFSEI